MIKPTRAFLAAFALVVLASPSLATADPVPPARRPARKRPARKPPKPVVLPPITAALDVTFSQRARKAVIKLPHAIFTQLLARAQRKRRGAWLAPEGRTVIAGTAMALTIALMGLWLARDRRRRTLLGPLLIVIGLATVLFFAGTARSKQRVQNAYFRSKGLVISVARGRTVQLEIEGNKACGSVGY